MPSPDVEPIPSSRATGKELEPYADEAKRILRAEMIRRGFSFKRLALALDARGDGPTESVQTLINKVNRGRFSFAFFLRATRAMGMTTVDLAPLPQVQTPESASHPTLRGAAKDR